MFTRFIATAYFAAFMLVFRLHQITFMRKQVIAALSARTVNFAINKILVYRGRRRIAADSALNGDIRICHD
jgi:predicted membrane GTPase involved in stress response